MIRMPELAKRTGTTERGPNPQRGLARAALRWFERNQRNLPWRKNKSRYRVWVSEIMLQQTQVATVVPYFRRFMKEFPSVASLAAADESDVLRAWEGLGYYRRASLLHEAAGVIVRRHGGHCPDTIDEWLALPGIGRYTAGAILSICDDQRLPILEANTIRLYSRLMALPDNPRSPAAQAQLWEFAEQVLPARRVGDFNQAMMEIGSQICSPRSPACPRCPLRGACRAFANGTVGEIPFKSAAVKTTRIRQVAVVICRGDRCLLRKSAAGRRWKGLWDIPRFEGDWSEDAKVAELIREQTGLALALGEKEFSLRHGVTRFSLDVQCYRASQIRGRLRAAPESGWAWVSLEDVGRLPLNVSARKILRRLFQ